MFYRSPEDFQPPGQPTVIFPGKQSADAVSAIVWNRSGRYRGNTDSARSAVPSWNSSAAISGNLTALNENQHPGKRTNKYDKILDITGNVLPEWSPDTFSCFFQNGIGK